MNQSVAMIPLSGMAAVLLPALVVTWILGRWCNGMGEGLYAIARMVLQLVAIGYVLSFLFESDSVLLLLLVLTVMLFTASWIALRPAGHRDARRLLRALGSIALGGTSTLAVVLLAAFPAETRFTPRVVIPIAGMIFANSMNSVSLALDRFQADLGRGLRYEEARAEAFRTALIPKINFMLAVGLVSLPGMMTGQILAGVASEIAVRYQIVVMSMLLGGPGLSAACYLAWSKDEAGNGTPPERNRPTAA